MRGTRLVRGFVAFGVAAALTAGAAYAATRLVGGSSGQTAVFTGDPSVPCDRDGVQVGYDLRYDSAVHGFAVVAVRVLGIAPECSGASLAVALDGAGGAPLAGGSATADIDGTTARLVLGDGVSAASVGRVNVSLSGFFENVAPIPPPPPSPPAPPAVAPSLCAAISATLSATAPPGSCGAVSVPAPATGQAAVEAVVSWAADTFAAPVTVSLSAPPVNTMPAVVHDAGTFVQLTVVSGDTHQEIHTFSTPLALDFPVQTADVLAAYSEDGKTWVSIPRLQSPSLPPGQKDGYYLRSDGTATVLTLHATYFSLIQPPTAPSAVRARPLADGTVRLTWEPSQAGLGIGRYQLLRDGRVAKTVAGTQTLGVVGSFATAKPSTYQVTALDTAGHTSDPSATVGAAVPLVTYSGLRVRRSGAFTIVRTRMRLTDRAGLRVSVLSASGRLVPIGTGSTVGTVVVGRRAAPLALGSLGSGIYNVTLRLATAKLGDGRPYRIAIVGHAGAKSGRIVATFRPSR